jgi:hypothetical protein
MRGLCAVALILLSIAWLIPYGAAQENPTFADVLKQHSTPFPPATIPHLNSKITSFDILDDEQEFVIAYYLDNPKNELRAPLLVTRLNKVDGRWDHAAFAESELAVTDIKDSANFPCLGSVMKVQRNAQWYFLTLHWNPSAGCFIVLKSDLRVEDARTGGIAETFRSGLVVADGNMVHFADVHPQTLYLYEPATHKAQPLYPQEHDPFRDDFSARLEKTVDQNLCRKNNWGCQTDQFTTDLSYPPEINDDTGSIAFRASFEPEGFLERDAAEASGKWDDDSYAYVFQLAPFRWREFSVYDLKPKFGTDSLKDLISPEMIEKVFATPAPK